MRTIEIICQPDGTVHVQVDGMTGLNCVAETLPLEQALGFVNPAREFKMEAYLAETVEARQYGG